MSSEKNTQPTTAKDRKPPHNTPHSTLPDTATNVKWASEPEIMTMGSDSSSELSISCVRPKNSGAVLKIGDYTVRSSELLYITDGAKRYRDLFASGPPIDIPEYYATIPNFQPLLTGKTVASRGGGYGITPARLEILIRLFTGGGHYCADDLRVTPTGGHPILIEDTTTSTDEGLLITPAQVDYRKPYRAALPDQDHYRYQPTPTASAPELPPALFEVVEHDPGIQTALDRLYTVLVSAYDLTPLRSVSQPSDHQSHVFETTDGTTIRASLPTLVALQKGNPIPSSSQSVKEIEPSQLSYRHGDSLGRPRSAVVTYAKKIDDQEHREPLDNRSNTTVVYRAVYLTENPDTESEVAVKAIRTADSLSA